MVSALAEIASDGRGRPAGEMLPRLVQAARRHLGMEVSFISEFTAGERVFRYVDSSASGLVRVGDGDPLEDSYCQRVVDGRLPELIVDAREVPAAAELPATAALPVGAHVAVPLRLSDGRLYGTFCCFSRSPDRSLNDRDLGVVRMFADLASASIEADLEAAEDRERSFRRITAALTREGFLTTVYQPIVGLRDGWVVGVEALSRFPRQPDRAADAWFAEAASIGLGVELESRAVRSALGAASRLPDGAFLAVNVSPAVVGSGRLHDALASVDLQRVVLEMTEHAPVADYDQLNAALRPLRRRGLRVAVDDAGAGYASLRHILRLRPEWIKLDISITRDVDTDTPRAALAAAFIAFAAEIGSDVIAEGLETEGELRTVQSLGATAGQGFHLGRPGDLAEAFEATPVPVAGA